MCAAYLASNLPKILLKGSRTDLAYPALDAASENVFLLQFTANFLIYAASNKQYREAYLLLFASICRRNSANSTLGSSGRNVGPSA